MLPRQDVVGHRIADIVGDSTSSDESFNITDFVYVLDNDIAIRMPYDDESGDLLPLAIVTPNHERLDWPKSRWLHYKKNLWGATLADVLIPQEHEERYPDRGAIKLSSGWFLTELSGAPNGIAPAVYMLDELNTDDADDAMVSVWDAIATSQCSVSKFPTDDSHEQHGTARKGRIE